MENVENTRTLYRTVRAACLARSGESAAEFDREARALGTQDGEGEPATPADYIRGALEIAHNLGMDTRHFFGGR